MRMAGTFPIGSFHRSRWLRDASDGPTATVYFSGPLSPLIGEAGSRKPIWRLGANVYHRYGDVPQTVVLRQFDRRTERAMARHPGTIHYVIDDDVAAGTVEPDLSAPYRRRLARLRAGVHRTMMVHAEYIYVPSDALARVLRTTGTIERIDPALNAPVATLDHHDEALRLVFPGTRSHLADLLEIAPMLARFLRAHPDASLTTWLGSAVPDTLRLPNATHLATLDWPMFQGVLRRERFHAALLPARPTAFNAARSHNKLLECACLGAAPLTGLHAPYAETVREEGGIVVEDWSDTLAWAIRDRVALKEVARRNVNWARTAGDPGELVRFWSERLDLPDM